MIFQDTGLAGSWLVDLEKKGDERGFFARFFCEDEFSSKGLETDFVQINTSLSVEAGTLRGMHYQLPPAGEVKVVRCIKGALWDCIIDLRPDSPTYQKWYGAELNENNRTMLYVPRGFAHGFITLCANTEALYLVSNRYAPNAERGLRWNDPALAIEWPRTPAEISVKDQSWPDFNPEFHGTDLFRSAALDNSSMPIGASA